MKLNRLPVLIRTEVTAAAAKGVNLPAVYSRALVALEEAVNELSFSKLKTVEVSVEGLAAWAKAHQDEKLSKTARELKFRARRTANYIAEQLVKQRKAAFIARGGKLVRGGRAPSGERIGIRLVLTDAGYGSNEIENIRSASAVPDTPDFAQKTPTALREAARGNGRFRKWNLGSSVYRGAFHMANSPLSRCAWFRENRARSLALQINDDEIAKARNTVTLVKAWCEEFLKNLPRHVSQAKVEK